MLTVRIFLYSKCYFDDIVIAIGRTINSFSGGFNTLTTLGVYFINLLNLSDSSNDLVKMIIYFDGQVDPVIAADPDASKLVGKVLGKILKKILNVQVPEVKYSKY